MRKALVCLLAALLLAGLTGFALAGENHLVVATDGEGIPVYTSAVGGRRAGVLYNGFDTYSIGLEETNGRYECRLTKETTVWVNQAKAQDLQPESFNVYGNPGTEAIPCSCYLAEVVTDGAKLWSGTGHRHALAEHRAGTLVLVCGAFGNDCYVLRAGEGFMAKSDLRKVRDLTYLEAYDNAYGAKDPETATVWLDQAELELNASATGVSEMTSDIKVKNGSRLVILRDLGDWAQVVPKGGGASWCRSGGFIEKRYLDPEGDHGVPTATVKTTHPLNRLNLRYSADKNSGSEIKLCSGLKVQVISSANGWTEVAMYAEKGSWSVHGFVMSTYLATGAEAESVPNACVRVRLLRDCKRSQYSREVYPAGTEGTVIGVDTLYRFVVRLDDGEVCYVDEEGTEPVLEPIDPPVWEAKTTKKIALREGPSSDAKKIRSLKSGVKVEVLLRGEKWVLVRVNGEVGYILNSAVKPTKIR